MNIYTAIATGTHANRANSCTSAETIFLSGLYIYYFWQNLQDIPSSAPDEVKTYTRRTFRLLVFAYALELLYQSVTLTLMCLQLILARHVVDPPVFGIKLAVELVFLTRLVQFARMRSEVLQRGNISRTMVEERQTDVEEGVEKKPGPARDSLPSAQASLVWGTNVGGRGMDIDVFQTVEPYRRSPREEVLDRVSDSAPSEESAHSDIDELQRCYLGRSNTGMSDGSKVERYYFGHKSSEK